jgi:hypothetical protein
VTAYVVGEIGRPLPFVPVEAPCGVGADIRCKVGVHHVRERSTGPGFDLVVVHCHTHRQFFTLYPPGYSPYARRPVAPVAPDGGLPRADGKEKAENLRGSLFDAAVDAAAGHAWPREHQGASERWWRTQLRQLEVAGAALGLSETADSGLRHEIAETLAIPALVIEEQARGFRGSGVGYRKRGVAVDAVLSKLSQTSLLPDRLLEAGHLAGCWGTPYRCRVAGGTLKRYPFRAAISHRTQVPRHPP